MRIASDILFALALLPLFATFLMFAKWADDRERFDHPVLFPAAAVAYLAAAAWIAGVGLVVRAW